MAYPVTTVTKVPISNRLAYTRLRYDSQKPPFNLMLKMDNRYHRIVPVGPRQSFLAANTSPTGDQYLLQCGVDRGMLTNRAYNKMISSLPDAASLGATLTAERRETFGMIVDLVGRMLKAARQVARLDLINAAITLGVPLVDRSTVVTKRRRIKNRKGKTVRTIKYKFRHTALALPDGRELSKTAASGWLLWSYGIAPLAGDVHTALATILEPFPWTQVSGSAREKLSFAERLITPDGPVVNYWINNIAGEVSIKQSCYIRVNNPNLWLASRLGLVNPVQFINEGIPFSFVVDWFSNWSDVIGSLTDFVGLDVAKPCVNQKISVEQFVAYTNYRWEPENPASDRLISKYTSRQTDLEPPTFRIAYERFQWQRGLNAISLLVGFLPNIKP